MATLSVSARNAGVDAIVTLLNNGTTNVTPRLIIGTNNMSTTLATLNFSVDAFANASNGVAYANTITSAYAVTSGVAAAARFLDRDENIIIDNLTVGTTSASNIQFGDVNFTIGSIVSLNQLIVSLP